MTTVIAHMLDTDVRVYKGAMTKRDSKMETE